MIVVYSGDLQLSQTTLVDQIRFLIIKGVDGDATVWLKAPDGSVIFRQTIRLESSGQKVIYLASPVELAAGIYRVEVNADGASWVPPFPGLHAVEGHWVNALRYWEPEREADEAGLVGYARIDR